MVVLSWKIVISDYDYKHNFAYRAISKTQNDQKNYLIDPIGKSRRLIRKKAAQMI